MNKKDYPAPRWDKNDEVASAPQSLPKASPSQQKLVINDNDKLAVIQIHNPTTGAKDEAFIQPMSRAKLPPGYVVSPVSLARCPRLIQNTASS